MTVVIDQNNIDELVRNANKNSLSQSRLLSADYK